MKLGLFSFQLDIRYSLMNISLGTHHIFYLLATFFHTLWFSMHYMYNQHFSVSKSPAWVFLVIYLVLTGHIMPVSIGTVLMTDLNSAVTAGLVPVANAIQTRYTIRQPFIAEFSISRLGDSALVPPNELAGACEMSTQPRRITLFITRPSSDACLETGRIFKEVTR